MVTLTSSPTLAGICSVMALSPATVVTVAPVAVLTAMMTEPSGTEWAGIVMTDTPVSSG